MTISVPDRFGHGTEMVTLITVSVPRYAPGVVSSSLHDSSFAVGVFVPYGTTPVGSTLSDAGLLCVGITK